MKDTIDKISEISNPDQYETPLDLYDTLQIIDKLIKELQSNYSKEIGKVIRLSRETESVRRGALSEDYDDVWKYNTNDIINKK